MIKILLAGIAFNSHRRPFFPLRVKMKKMSRKFLQRRAKRNFKRDIVIPCIGFGCEEEEELVEESSRRRLF